MNFNDDDFDFSEDDFDEYENNLNKFPLFQKAMEIEGTVDALCAGLCAEDYEMYASLMRESAMIIPAKIAGAFSTGSWLVSMQNAAIIRDHAQYLLSSTSGLKMFTNADKNYVQVMRDEMMEFRTLFAEWVSTFDKLDDEDYEDDWGLFKRKK